MAETEDLIRLTAEIVSAHAEGNSVATSDLPALIVTVHDALAGLGQEDASGPEVPFPMREAGAVSVRKSLASRDKLISMIDGKPYSTLKRHIARHGFTPESYRERFGLKSDYPMVAPAYSEVRKAAAKAIGLGRKIVGVVAAGAAVVALAEALVPASKKLAKTVRKPPVTDALPGSTQDPMALVETVRETGKRGRKPKAEVPEAAPAIEAEEAARVPKRRGRPPKPKADLAAPELLGESPLPESERAPDDEFFDIARDRQSPRSGSA